jgi:hypothetical protein
MGSDGMGKAAMTVVWAVIGLALPFIFAVAMGVAQDRWTLQDTPRSFIAMGLAALVYFAIVASVLLLLRVQLSWRPWGGLVLWALLGGWYAGPLFLNMMNSAGVQAPGRPVELKVVPASLRQLIRLGVANEDDALKGTTFTCSKSRWGTPTPKQRTAVVRRGRLGLWWAELP